MDDPRAGLLTDPALAELRKHTMAVRSLDREAKTRRIVTIMGGWAVAGFMTIVAGGCLGIMWNRPAPRDLLYVALMHDDGTYDPPMAREDMDRNRQDILFRHTVIQYVFARENYSWEGVNENYLRASALSAPTERERFQEMMLNRRNPENPAIIYGEGVGASKADVTGIQVRRNPGSPNAVDAMFVLRIMTPGQPPRTVRKTARMTWMPAADKISPKIQQLYDPAGIAFTSYASSPDPEANG